jgi:hypothetical protein
MKKLFDMTLKILFSGGGWFPLLVFISHLFTSRILHLYEIWPSTDVPMHFLGGVSIAFLISKSFQLLPRKEIDKTRIFLLELLLIGSVTAATTVFWEFAEFIYDQLFLTNIQISLANTMKDMAMGILGAAAVIFIRSRQLHVGIQEIQKLSLVWLHGYVTEPN